MAPQQALMTRVGYAAAQIAGALAGYQVGDRLPPLGTLAATLGCGVGTIQAAIKLLEDNGAITVEARGHLGSFLTKMNHVALWEFAGNKSVSISMPLPYTLRYEGLATGIMSAFQAHQLPLSLMYLRGSVARVQALKEGRTDYAIMSGLAAAATPGIEVVYDLGPESYVGSHAIIVEKGRSLKDPNLRIGVDSASTDVVNLVAKVFGDIPPKRLVNISYNQVDRSFLTGAIDATVWNADEISDRFSAAVDIYPIADLTSDANTRAVVVRASSPDPAPIAVLDTLKDPLVTKTAALVMDGTILPTY